MFQIIDFNRHYITSDMRRKKVKRPSWFKCPIESPEVLSLIHTYDDGLAYLGIWERLQGWAVRNHVTQGAFVLKTGPMTLGDLAIHCGLPRTPEAGRLLEAAIGALLNLGWLADIPEATYESVAYREDIRTDSGLHNTTGHEITGQENIVKAARSQPMGWSAEQGWVGIKCEDMDRWREAYPAVDIDMQLTRSDSWLRANPAKARRKLWGRFITNWLGRSQERGGDIPSNKADQQQATGWANEARRETA